MAPSRKRPSAANPDGDSFIDDSHDHDPGSRKRSKKNSTDAPLPAPDAIKPRSDEASTQTDENGDEYWELNAAGTRRVTVSVFKGMRMVSVREYYGKEGKMLPAKKGISLPVEQFEALVEVLPSIEEALRGRRERVPRVGFQRVGGGEDETGEGGGREEKKNFEATSDEDKG